MGIFGSLKRLGDVEIALAKLQTDLERGGEFALSERIVALEKAVESQGSTLRMLKVEWESVLHKVNGVMGRLNARIRKSEAQDEPVSDAEPTPQGVAPIGTHAALAARRGR